MCPDQPNPEMFGHSPEPCEENHHPADASQPDHPKRNSGRTGPTSPEGRATSARNSTRHGLCSKTLILNREDPAEWDELLAMWVAGYQNPAEGTLLHSFVHQAAQAQWLQRRAQFEYDFFIENHSCAPITLYQPHELKDLDLVQRYLTTAERRFQRQYRLLQDHWKAHHKAPPEPKKADPEPESDSPDPEIQVLYVNNETGESVDCYGNKFPPPADWVFRPIIPGVYDPDHPAYEGPPPRE